MKIFLRRNDLQKSLENTEKQLFLIERAVKSLEDLSSDPKRADQFDIDLGFLPSRNAMTRSTQQIKDEAKMSEKERPTADGRSEIDKRFIGIEPRLSNPDSDGRLFRFHSWSSIANHRVPHRHWRPHMVGIRRTKSVLSKLRSVYAGTEA